VNLKILMLASVASVSLAAMSAVAQTAPQTAPQTATDLNSPAAHKATTVTEPDGKAVQTPPVGMRSGDKNAGGG